MYETRDRIRSVFLTIVLVIVGGVSFLVARTVRYGIGHGRLIGNDNGSSSPSRRTAIGTLMTISLTLAVFVPMWFVSYVAIALVGHALGQ